MSGSGFTEAARIATQIRDNLFGSFHVDRGPAQWAIDHDQVWVLVADQEMTTAENFVHVLPPHLPQRVRSVSQLGRYP